MIIFLKYGRNYALEQDIVPWGIPPSAFLTEYSGSCSIFNSFQKIGRTTDDLWIQIGIIKLVYFWLPPLSLTKIVYNGNVVAYADIDRSYIGQFNLSNDHIPIENAK